MAYSEQHDLFVVEASTFPFHRKYEDLLLRRGNYLASVCHPKTSHTFSIGFKSEKFTGEVVEWISSV